MKTLSDLTAPAPIVRKPLLEAEVQEKCVAWARARGYWARKFSSISQRSVPDYLFRGRGISWATEFKRAYHPIDPETGRMSTKAQVEEQQLMRAAGWTVFECDNIDVFQSAVFAMERGE
jgi:hypothetical protein